MISIFFYISLHTSYPRRALASLAVIYQLLLFHFLLIIKGFSREDDCYEYDELTSDWFDCYPCIAEVLWKSSDNVLEVRDYFCPHVLFLFLFTVLSSFIY